MKKRKQKKTGRPQLIVPTPPWLQRRMLKNLQLAAHCRVSPACAQRALEILAAIRVDSTPQTEPVRKNTASVVSPSPKVIPGWASRIRRFASAVFLKVRFCLSKQRPRFTLEQAR